MNRIAPSKPQFDFITSQQNVNLFLSGQGGGKTYVGGVVSGQIISKYPKIHGFIGANTYTQLTDSTLFRIRSVWKKEFGWTEYDKANPGGHYVTDIIPPKHFNTEGHQYDSYYNKICFAWGTVIYKGSLDHYKAHDGKEFGWALLDETKDTKEVAVKEVILGRLREHGMFTDSGEPWNPLFILTSPAKVKWINDWFSLDEYMQEITKLIYSETTYFKKQIGNKSVVICSVYHNKRNLPANYIENQKANQHAEQQDMLIYGNPFAKSGSEYFPSFDYYTHVGKCKYDPSKPLNHTFDFNVVPYMTSLQIQVEKKDNLWWVYVIKNICPRPPNSRTRATCKIIMKEFGGHKAGGFYTGDHTKKARNTDIGEEYEHAYDIIEEELYKILSARPDRTIPNMPNSKRRDFMLRILENKLPIRLLIDESCKETIDDFRYLKQGPDGEKLKEEETDPVTKKKFQPRGHTSDALEYFLTSTFYEWVN